MAQLTILSLTMMIYVRRATLLFFVAATLLLAAACDERTQEASGTACTPSCDKTCGTPDGCGGVCPCSGSDTPAPDSCLDTCESTQSTCGSVCGMACGQCAEGLTCLEGQCLGPVSCADCGLQLAVRESDGSGDVEVEVRFAPAESDPRPRMIDLRVRPSRPVQLVSVSEGPAMAEAEKSFHQAPGGQPWKQRADGSYQVTIQSLESTLTIEGGLLATLRFRRDSMEALSFALEKRLQTFVPLSADAPLQATPYGRAAVAEFARRK